MSSGIEWTDKTWNPVVGCTPVSPGCLNCYAATMARRLHAMTLKGRNVPGYDQPLTEKRGGRAVFNGTVRCLDDRLTEPMKWRKPCRVFVNSMSDLFHEAVPFDFIDRVFAVMALCPQHTFQVLTKRPERMAEYFAAGRGQDNDFGWHFSDAQRRVKVVADILAEERRQGGIVESNWNNVWPLQKVWLGTSCENQAAAKERIPHLLRCPAAVRFLSCEPLIGPVDLFRNGAWGTFEGKPAFTHGDHADWLRNLQWIIVGGESGPKARACDIAWIRSIVQQCKDAQVPCFVKQAGSRVVCRNDEVSDWLDQCHLSLDDIDTEGVMMQGDPVRVMLRDRKGGDPAEWPEDLRVREWPEVRP